MPLSRQFLTTFHPFPAQPQPLARSPTAEPSRPLQFPLQPSFPQAWLSPLQPYILSLLLSSFRLISKHWIEKGLLVSCLVLGTVIFDHDAGSGAGSWSIAFSFSSISIGGLENRFPVKGDKTFDGVCKDSGSFNEYIVLFTFFICSISLNRIIPPICL